MKKIKENKVKWGILGVGDVCEVKSAPAMNIVPDSEIVAVMRRNGEKAKDYAQRHHVPKWYDNADALINDPDINAIYVATPPNIHAEMAIKVAAAGKPVYVEKPMAKTYKECILMIEAFKKAGVPLYVAYYRRALPNFLFVKEQIENGVIGDVRMVKIEMYKPLQPDIITHQDNHWRVNPEIAGGGYFYDLASHQLDMLDFLFGPIKYAEGRAANQGKLYKADDIVTASFGFDSGILGTGSWCFSTGKCSDKEVTTIIGSTGQIEFGTFADTSVTITTDEDGKQYYPFLMPKHIQTPMIDLVVKDLLGTGHCPCTGIIGARTNWVMEQMCQKLS